MEKVCPKIMPGFMELLPEDQILFNDLYDKIRKVYEKYGFLPLDTPLLEYSSVLLAKAGGETEKQIYRFKKGDNDISLRFDLTVPLARYVAGRYNELIFPFKRYQMGKVYRGERPQKGRFREFYQCDIDVIGEELSLIYDAEIPMVIYDIFKSLNLGKFTIRINNRKVLNGFFEYLGLTNEITDILRIIDKIDKIGKEEVEKELIDIIKDKQKVDKVLDFISISGSNDEVLSKLKELNINNETFNKGIEELSLVTGYLKDLEVEESYYKIDLTIARGLDYYTGTVYETVLNDYPNIGSVCSGGRYDNLAKYYTDINLEGVGISIGLTRLFYKLKEAGIISSNKKTLNKVLIIPFDKTNIPYAIKVSKKVREAGLNCDTYYLDKGIKQKMKYANRIGIKYVCILGADEEKSGKVALKNMETGDQKLITIDEMINIISD